MNWRLLILRILVHLGGWFPLAWLLWDGWHNNLTVNPIQAITQRTGRYALTLLVFSLACTPANTFFGLREVLKVRRSLGLYAFFYALLHFLSFSVLDYSLKWSLIVPAIFEKRYVIVGFTAFLILLALASTSFLYWQKKLGRRWKQLHQLVYLAGLLVVLHYGWASKGDMLLLRGDVAKPFFYGLAVILLLLARIPTIRRFASRLRSWIRARWFHLSA